MGVYGSPELYPHRQDQYQNVPSITDYIKWMMIPGLLSLVTCGIGGIILMIVWAADNKNMARANYFRAIFILAGIGIGIVFFMVFIVGGLLSTMLQTR